MLSSDVATYNLLGVSYPLINGRELEREQFGSISPGLLVPLTVEGTLTSDAIPDGQVRARATWDPRALRYRLNEVTFVSESGIAPADVRLASLPQVVADLTAEHLYVQVRKESSEESSWARMHDVINVYFDQVAKPEEIRASGPTETSLYWTALLYSYGRAIGVSPNKMVVSVLGLPQRTATRWIAVAKQKGLIDEPTAEERNG